MEDKRQTQAASMGVGPDNAQAAPGAQQTNQGMGQAQYAQPQPGGFYQYVSGAGFVQVLGPPQMNPTMQTGMGMQTDMGAADASAQAGMFGQGTPEGAEPKFDQNKLGQMYGVMNDVMNGEADPAKIMSLFQNTDGDFWKGAIVGAAAGFLASNETVRNAVAGVFGSLLGGGDPEGPQVTVDDKSEK